MTGSTEIKVPNTPTGGRRNGSASQHLPDKNNFIDFFNSALAAHKVQEPTKSTLYKNLPNTVISLENGASEIACEQARVDFLIYMKTVVIPKIIQPQLLGKESKKTIRKSLRRKHAEYLSTHHLDHSPTIKHFAINNILYTDAQQPASYYTEEQQQLQQTKSQNGAYQSSCYFRYQEGLANFNKEQLLYNSKKIWGTYRHASPVALVDNFKTRIEMTERNLRQLAVTAAGEIGSPEKPNSETIPLEVTISEIRLLSALRPIIEKPFKKDESREILEMYLALLRCDSTSFKNKGIHIKPKFKMADFGVNKGRFELASNPLLTQINTRYFNETFENMFDKLGIKYENTELKKSREELTNAAKKLDLTDKKNTLNAFKKALKKHHAEEVKQLKQYRALWEEQKAALTENKENRQLIETFNLAIDLYFDKSPSRLWQRKYQFGKYNYSLPALLTVLEYLLENKAAMGCMENKDRASFVAITAITLSIFYNQKLCYPNFENKEDLDEFYIIQERAFKDSSSYFFTSRSAAPGVNGFQLSAGNGNPYIKANSGMASLFKDIYEPLTLEEKMFVTLSKKKNNFILSGIFAGFLFIFSTVFGVAPSAMADNVGFNNSMPTNSIVATTDDPAIPTSPTAATRKTEDPPVTPNTNTQTNIAENEQEEEKPKHDSNEFRISNAIGCTLLGGRSSQSKISLADYYSKHKFPIPKNIRLRPG